MTTLKAALEAKIAKERTMQRYIDIESEISKAIISSAANAANEDGNAAMKHSQSVVNLSNALSTLRRDVFE